VNGASVTRPQVRPGGGRQTAAAAGFSFVELMLVAGVMATMSLVAIGTTRQAVERYRTAGAARYLAGRLQRARSDAVARGASVALRFSPPGDPVTFSVFVDGNRNGVLSSDIAAGVDTEIAAPTDLSSFAGVSFGVIAGVVSPEGEVLSGEPIHCGAARMASFTTRGTATSGSFYIRGKTEQFVVRVYGDTGKTSIMRFDVGRRQWVAL
jgi:type II secretion system GspH-like protein